MRVSRLLLFSRWLMIASLFYSVPGTSAVGPGDGEEKAVAFPIIDESHRHDVINTGIPAPGKDICWYDDTRLVFLKVRYSSGMSNKRVEGLYYLDVGRPHDIKQVNLAPLDPVVHKEIGGIYCQEDVVWFYIFPSDMNLTRLYLLRLGQSPELISEMRGGKGNLKGHYVIGNSRRTSVAKGPLRGAFEGYDDCAVSYIRSGFKVLCWDLWLSRIWTLPNLVLNEYIWDDTVKVRGEDGKPRWIPNPATRLISEDGRPLSHALFLRDLDQHILVRADQDDNFVPWVGPSLVVNRQGSHAYVPCSLRRKPLGWADRVCRYRLDGTARSWEQVFRFELPDRMNVGIQELSVNAGEEVYFVIHGAANPSRGIWLYKPHIKVITHVTQPGDFKDDSPLSSPNGHWLALFRSNKESTVLSVLRMEEVRPR